MHRCAEHLVSRCLSAAARDLNRGFRRCRHIASEDGASAETIGRVHLRRPLLSGTCLQLHGHTGGGEGLEVRNWHAWRCRHYRRAVLHAHVRHKHRRAGRRRARRWQVAAGLQAAVPSSAALRCSRRLSPPPSAPGNRSRARRLSSPGHGGGGSSSRWQCLLASVCRRARFAARVQPSSAPAMDNSRLIAGLGAPSAGSLWRRTSERTLALPLATARGLSRHSGSIRDARRAYRSAALPLAPLQQHAATAPQPHFRRKMAREDHAGRFR